MFGVDIVDHHGEMAVTIAQSVGLLAVEVDGQFDFVFLDAWKRDYQKFFDLVFPRMPKGALFVAHNVLNKKSEMPDFLNTIETRRDLFSTIVAPSGEGVSVSWKRQ